MIECLEGPLQGKRIQLSAGARMGRSTGEIIIPDPKVSALHAQVELSGKGQLFLIDRGSANGLRIHGKRVQKVALLAGVVFQVGRSYFKVLEAVSKEDDFPVPENLTGWREILRGHAPRLSAQNQSGSILVTPLEPLVELTFTAGLQYQSRVLLGYGPRKAGRGVLDIELHDPNSPEVAFELIPIGEGLVQFKTDYPEKVTLNGLRILAQELQSGDQIQVCTSIINFRYVE